MSRCVHPLIMVRQHDLCHLSAPLTYSYLPPAHPGGGHRPVETRQHFGICFQQYTHRIRLALIRTCGLTTSSHSGIIYLNRTLMRSAALYTVLLRSANLGGQTTSWSFHRKPSDMICILLYTIYNLLFSPTHSLLFIHNSILSHEYTQ